MYVCMHYVCMRIYVALCLYAYLCLHVCMYVCMHNVCMRIYVALCLYAYLWHTCMHALCMYAYLWHTFLHALCMYAFLCLYTVFLNVINNRKSNMKMMSTWWRPVMRVCVCVFTYV